MATISYVPNDPLASGGPPTRSTRASNYPRGDIAKFDIQPTAVAGKFDPHTPEFQYWQAKLGLIAGLRAWRQIDGRFMRRWFGDQNQLAVRTDAGDDLNAFYDRDSLQFFSHTFGGVTVNSAESVDVVTHEEGHAFLDAIRPDFFDVPFIEVGALHEAFGDCMAIVTALEDRAIRDAVLASTPDLVGQPLRGKPGRGARRRDRAGVRSEQRRRRGAPPCPQHVPVGRPHVAAAECPRRPALR